MIQMTTLANLEIYFYKGRNSTNLIVVLLYLHQNYLI